MRQAIVGSTVALMLSGCATLGPDYTSPKMSFAASYMGSGGPALREAAELAWWRYLNDPVLNDLVATGLAQNLGVRAALERIVAARENVRRFGLSQQINGDVAIESLRSDLDDNGGLDSATATADAFFVFDLFGEFRRGRERSLAELEAAQYDVGTVRLAYLSDIVTNYILARYYETAAAITRQSIASRRQTLEAVRERAGAEEGTELEVARARSLLASAEATLPILVAQARVSAFRIATLLNVPTATVMAKLNAARQIPRPSGGAAAGVPADLLRNRPDVRRAERNLAAATAGIGVAEAQLYPSLRLGGTVAAGATDGWSFGPRLTIPVLDQPRRRAAREIAVSNAREAELAYRQEIVQAIEEVEAALALTDARRRQVSAYERAVNTAERALDLSRSSYRADLIPLDDVLDAERTRLSNRLDLALALSEWAQAWVRLQVATGKGWSVSASTTLAALLK